MSPNIRVAIANQPRLMRDLIMATMSDQPDIEVVAEIRNESEIVGIVEKTSPEFLIIALDRPMLRPPICDQLLRQFPSMKILAVAPDGNWSVFYWASLEIHAADLEPSENGILHALRSHQQAGRTCQ